MILVFGFSSFREKLDIFSGVLEPWNRHCKGKIDQKQSYYKARVKHSER